MFGTKNCDAKLITSWAELKPIPINTHNYLFDVIDMKDRGGQKRSEERRKQIPKNRRCCMDNMNYPIPISMPIHAYL